MVKALLVKGWDHFSSSSFGSKNRNKVKNQLFLLLAPLRLIFFYARMAATRAENFKFSINKLFILNPNPNFLLCLIGMYFISSCQTDNIRIQFSSADCWPCYSATGKMKLQHIKSSIALIEIRLNSKENYESYVRV